MRDDAILPHNCRMTNADSPSPQPAAASGADVLKLLAGRYAVFRDALPLAIGIHKTVLAAAPELDAGAVRAALRRHTASTRYLKAVATGTQRHGLDGQPAGEVTDEQKQQAAETLRERFKKGAERKREEARVKQEQERAAARERQHQEKLAALANKFARR